MNARASKVDLGAWVMRLVLLVFGAAVLIGGASYGVRTADGLVGPGLMPAVAGFVMVAASLWECATAVRKDRAQAAPDLPADVAAEEADAPAKLDVFGRSADQRNRAVVLVFGVILLTVVLSYVIGLLLALTAMVIVLLGFVEKKPWWVALVGGVAAFVFGYLVFGAALNVPLSTGMLGLV